MRTHIAAIALSLAVAGSALAQTAPGQGSAPGQGTTGGQAGPSGATAAKSRAECETNWKSADKNSDGRLDQTELTSSRSMLPNEFTASTTVSQQEFITACTTPR